MHSFKNFIVGAYATSPALFIWDEDKEIEYLEYLKKELNPIRGLELPYYGDDIHSYDSKVFLQVMDKDWEYVLTCLPGTMKQLELNKHFGLASDNESGRQDAVNFYKEACDTIKNINIYFQSKKIISVVIPTAPGINKSGVSSSEKSLEKSLVQLIELDWDGAKIVIEHCDSGRNENSVKGFLSLDEEIQVVNKLNEKYRANIGITVNWARSAIEYRDEKGAVKHIKELNKHSLLSGLMFSGTGKKSTSYGSWTDLHWPVGKEEGIICYEEDSLMSKENISECLTESDYESLDYLGVKILAMPINESSLERRIGVNRDTMNILKQTIEGLK